LPNLQRRDVSAPDETREVPGDTLQLYQLGDGAVGWSRFEPGWRWSESIKPMAGTELCEFHHIGYTVSGRVRVQTRDGAELELLPHHFYEIPPYHDAWVVGDEPWVSIDWGPASSFAVSGATRMQRVLSTVLFTDVVDSTVRARELGDMRWRDLLAQHNAIVRRRLEQHGGREVGTTGDGFLALFDSAERAVHCAQAIAGAMPEIGLEVRAGIHTGEVELEAGNVRGLTVHVAARIVALAGPSQVLVSWTTRDLLAGSGLSFTDRGLHELKGLPDPRPVYEVTSG
jgi:class 3 adenylate cyclase